MERELDRELRYHLDRRVDDLMKTGVGDTEARRQARVEFGGYAQVQQNVRDIWIWRWLDERKQDLRYALRTLLRSPGFTATAVLSLAIGIGANAAIFSLLDQVLFRLLPVKEPERLVLLNWRGNQLADGWGSGNLMSYPICRDLQAQDAFFDGVFCRHPTTAYFSSGGQTQPVGAEIVSGSYFRVLGLSPALGRLIEDADDVHQDAHPVVVISHDYWQTVLGGAPDAIGRKVLLNNYPMTIIGVAPASFRGTDLGEAPALWVPAAMKRQVTPEWDRLLDRRARWMHVFGRLKPGMTVERAQAGLQPWFKSMLDEDTKREGFPRATAEQRQEFLSSRLEVLPGSQGRSGLRNGLRVSLGVLMAGTLLLLLLASLNVASLFVARGAARAREIRTRMAIGASRGRISGLLLTDSLLIAVAGGLLGLLVAPVVSRTLLSFLPQDASQVALTSAINRRVFAFAFGVSLLVGAFCGLAPAWQARRIPLISALKERAGNSAQGVRLRKALVIGQVAFTLILLICAGLFVRTLVHLHAKGPGFATDRLLTFRVVPLRNGHTREEAARIVRTLYDRFQVLPGIESSGLARNDLLTGGSWNNYLTIDDGRGRRTTDRLVHLNTISATFFSTLGTRVVAGRDFTERDANPFGSDIGSRVAIVNESFVRRYFPSGAAIGARIGTGNRPDTKISIEIVGVVKDFSYRGIREETEQAFLAYFEDSGDSGTFYLRTRSEPEAAFALVRRTVAEVDATLPVQSLRTLDAQVDRALTPERMLATLSSGFGMIALVLSVVGLCGVMSFVVTNRTQEIGIRLALGATPASAVRLVLKDAVVMLAIGTAIALPCAWGLGRLLESALFGVRAADVTTIAMASLLLTIAALTAALVPARRAATVRPTDALRFE
jgi:predicted permease